MLDHCRPLERKERDSQKPVRLGIPTVALIDTDCDPDSVDLPIPGNDDGIRSIELIMSHLADAVLSVASPRPWPGKKVTVTPQVP